jgi:subtilisin family serine protease
MKHLRTILCSSAFVAASLHAQTDDTLNPAPQDRALPARTVPDQYIVQVNAGENAGAVAAAHGVALKHVYRTAVRGFAGKVPPGRLAALAADPRVAHVVPDREVTAIAKPGSGGAGSGTTQTVPAGVQRIGAAPGSVAFTGAGVGVAVVDTGIDFNHADLQPVGAISFSAFGGSALDNNGHGTHCAGIVGGRNNTRDVVGVAPNAVLFAVKVLDAAGNGSDSDIVAGFDWIAANASIAAPAIRVANVSLGREGTIDDNPVLHAAVQSVVANGVAIIVAAGNDAALEISQQIPAGYPEVIAVSSTTAKNGTNQYRFFNGFIAADTASYFTTDGPGVAIAAPGEDQENINKAGFIQSVGILSTKLGGGTTRLSGTSMAAPHVAGVAALIWQKALSAGQTLTPADIRNRIINGASNPAAPLDSPTSSYTFDGTHEGILSAPGALGP